jgi:GNAT superfamily N-acetyltransferase
LEASYQIISYKAGALPKQYQAMVYSKWLRSLRYGNDYFRLIDGDAYFNAYHLYLENILAKASIRLSVLSDDRDVVLGFSVHRGSILDYIHVQKDYRKQGIGLALLPPDITIITHLTRKGMTFWSSKLPKAKFNPFA